ncbi:MAG TPA: hypothetical protein VK947_12785, partial [Planococcus sp. (in: firmicutes)]|nr:hypothetical protein [Planococcus sp. (in: firmicutes)]
KDGKINENQIIIDRDLGGSCNGNSENCNYSIYTIEKFAILDELISQRHTFHFKDNLEVGELKVGGGKEDSIRVDKNLYISGNLDITNHACIAIGGNFIVGQKILNKNKNKTDIYVYGDFFMTKDQKDTYDFDFHVRGTVYQYDSIHKEIKEVNRENFGIKNLTNQTTKNCNVTPYNNPDKFIESPLWKLSDDNIINYN